MEGRNAAYLFVFCQLVSVVVLGQLDTKIDEILSKKLKNGGNVYFLWGVRNKNWGFFC